MAEAAVIDAHHHLWDPRRREYPWLTADSHSPIRRPRQLGDFRTATATTGVAGTVLVQTLPDRSETRELLAVAASSGGLIHGVVGWCDLTAPDVGAALAELTAAPGGEHLVGIRHQVQDEPDPHWLRRPDVLAGLDAVAEAGLVYELLVRPRQLAVAAEVVRRLPQLTFVLDHGGKPPIASGAIDSWAVDVREIAHADNVVCKLSGLVTEASWTSWNAADIRPYADVLLAAFGPERLMFGSDWPVCELAATYSDVLDLARALVSGLDPAERTAVLGQTARDTYRLG